MCFWQHSYSCGIVRTKEMAVKGGTPPKTDGDAMSDLYKFLALVAVGLGLTVYLQILRNRQHWVILEAVIGVVFLLLVPFASSVIPAYLTMPADSLLIYLFRIMAFAKVSQSAVVYLTRNARDQTVGIAVTITNILSRAALVMCALHGLYYAKKVNKAALQVDMATCVLLLIGDAFHLSKLSTREGSLTIGDPISWHLSVDALLTFMLGSWVFGFPDMFLGVVNHGIIPKEGHLALCRVFGSFVIGASVLSFASLCFKNAEDAVSVLKSKLLLYAPAVIFALINYFTDGQYQHPTYTFFILCGMGALAVNAGYAVWNYEKSKQD